MRNLAGKRIRADRLSPESFSELKKSQQRFGHITVSFKMRIEAVAHLRHAVTRNIFVIDRTDDLGALFQNNQEFREEKKVVRIIGDLFFQFFQKSTQQMIELFAAVAYAVFLFESRQIGVEKRKILPRIGEKDQSLRLDRAEHDLSVHVLRSLHLSAVIA